MIPPITCAYRQASSPDSGELVGIGGRVDASNTVGAGDKLNTTLQRRTLAGKHHRAGVTGHPPVTARQRPEY